MLRKLQYNLAKLLRFPIDPGSDQHVKAMKAAIEKVGGRLNFIVQRHEDGWTAECQEIKGIITGGTERDPTDQKINYNIKDAIFTAFGIPPYLCNDELIKNIREPAREQNLVFA